MSSKFYFSNYCVLLPLFFKKATHVCSLLSCTYFLSIFYKEKVQVASRITISFLIDRNPFRFGSHHVVLQYHGTHLCSLMGCFCFEVYKKLKEQTRGDL